MKEYVIIDNTNKYKFIEFIGTRRECADFLGTSIKALDSKYSRLKLHGKGLYAKKLVYSLEDLIGKKIVD